MKKIKHILILSLLGFLPWLSLADELKEKNVIYLYADEGAGRECLQQTALTLEDILPHNYSINYINSEKIIDNEWIKDAALLIMPGGADVPYTKKLNGKGNQNIRSYVKNGGSYLGICAGSYYGSSYVEFDKGGEFEVLGKRELAFFPDSAIGPILAKYDYRSNSGCRATNIRLELEQTKESTIYYNGGGYFKNAASYSDVNIIGYYKNSLPAIVHIPFGKGNVILSGVHFEYNPSLLDTQDPYIKKICPDLKRSDATRRILAKAIFKKLGLLTK